MQTLSRAAEDDTEQGSQNSLWGFDASFATASTSIIWAGIPPPRTRRPQMARVPSFLLPPQEASRGVS